MENLALACVRCNLGKSSNPAGIDPFTNQITSLYHPRTDNWHDHFEYVGLEKMLSPETLESYRLMTPAERLRLTLDSMAENERFLLMGSDEQVSRKFDLLNQRNDERNQSLLMGLRLADPLSRHGEADKSVSR